LNVVSEYAGKEAHKTDQTFVTLTGFFYQMTKEEAYIKIKQLVDRFTEQLPNYKKSD